MDPLMNQAEQAMGFSKNQILMVLYDLPYLVLPEWYLPSREEKEVLDSMQQNYRAEAQWLDGYFSGYTPDLEDPRLHLGYCYAVLERRRYDICYEMAIRGAFDGITPENRDWFHLAVWGMCLTSGCRWILNQKNIPNMGRVEVKGKRELYKAASTAITAFALSPDTLRHQRKEPRRDYKQVKLIKTDQIDHETWFWHWLHGQAWKLAKKDKFFRDNFWNVYLSTHASLNNVIKRSGNIQARYILSDGSLFTTGKNSKQPRKAGREKC